MRFVWVLFAAVAAGAAPGAKAHQGPLDSYGCHPNVAHGTYHCHAGPLAGRQFGSKKRMIRAYEEEQHRGRPKPKLPAPSYASGRD